MSFDFSQFFVLDALVAASVIVGSLAFVYTIGKYSFVPMLAAAATAGAFTALAPFVGHIPGINSWALYQQQLIVFGALTLVAYVVYRRHAYFEPSSIPNGFELVVCGLLLAGFILAIVASFLSSDVLLTVSPQLRTIFADDVPRTLWLLSPVIAFGVMRGK